MEFAFNIKNVDTPFQVQNAIIDPARRDKAKPKWRKKASPHVDGIFYRMTKTSFVQTRFQKMCVFKILDQDMTNLNPPV